ncbi:MAG: hypothetical protein HQM09_19415 [Candidatus Riflebacteria bacterium]|nr:hypothetical protein [Candidatus Riflebacteria bacterium]
MKITNVFGLPESLVNAVSNDNYTAGPCDISCTTLLSPPRKVALEIKHASELTEDVSDRIWALFGQSIHVVLERAEREAMTERRYSIQRQNWIISGAFDRFSLTNGILQDFKVTTTWSVRDGPRQEWENQLNILATILREHGFDVKKLEVVVILRDWSKSVAQRGGEYPTAPALKIPIDLWSEERCEEYIDERIRLHQAARIKLPECTPDEKWSRPDVWALMKEGRKTAVRVFDNDADAYAALEVAGVKYFIEHRPGKDVRCSDYCTAALFCEQYQKSSAGKEMSSSA